VSYCICLVLLLKSAFSIFTILQKLEFSWCGGGRNLKLNDFDYFVILTNNSM